MSTTIFTTAATPASIESAYKAAQERYAAMDVDTGAVLKRLARVPISLHCWQGDDVGGFEKSGEEIGGGLAVTGNYPGKARTPDELRSDAVKALSLIPGKHRFNLHASYAETGGKRVERNALCPEHFKGWIEWCKEQGLGMDFNPTYFAHPKAADGMTLAHPDTGIRKFWIEHGIVCRQIGAAIGAALGTPCVTNCWIPDGMKDLPIDRVAPRQRLTEALDEIFAVPVNRTDNLDAVESKLFGIGSESYVVGSHEYYLGYALSRKKLLTLDTGHFHPTETIADKLSAVFTHLDEILLHVSRGIRWDSDHVVIVDDSLSPRPRTDSRRLPRSHAHRTGLLRRLDQSCGGMGHRDPRDAQGPAGRYARTDSSAARPGNGGRFHRPPGNVGRTQDDALRGRMGLPLPAARRAGGPGLDRRREAVRERRVVEAGLKSKPGRGPLAMPARGRTGASHFMGGDYG